MSKVLYLAHHALGDVVMKLPALRYLVDRFGHENIYITVREVYLKVFLSEQLQVPEKNFFIFSKSKFKLRDYVRFLCGLRKLKLDYYISPPSINRKLSNFLYYVVGAKRRIDSPTSYPSLPHKVLQNLSFINAFEADPNLDSILHRFYYLKLSKDSIDLVKFNICKPYLIAHIGSGVIEKHKRYPVNSWAKLVSLIIARFPQYQVILSGFGGHEDQLNNLLEKQVLNTGLLNLSSQLELNELIQLIAGAELFLSADCGPAHLASILRINQIALFGPTDEAITGPYGDKAKIIKLNPKLACMPCYGSKRYGITGCGNNVCMQRISEADVFNCVSQLLDAED